jgi:hypothetical protein
MKQSTSAVGTKRTNRADLLTSIVWDGPEAALADRSAI